VIPQIVHSREQLEDGLAAFSNRVRRLWTGDQPIEISWKIHRNPRSRSQNNLYWVWLDELARSLSTEEAKYSKEEMHDLMRYKFLGAEQIEVAGERITRIRSTTKLSRADMADYMTKVEAWALNLGIYLPVPEDNEYMSYREASQ